MSRPYESWFSKRRRYLLGALGLSAGGGLLPAVGATREQTAESYVLVQGDQCVPVAPLSGQVPVEEFYSYQLQSGNWEGQNGARDDGGPYFSSGGTRDLQRQDASLLFLYDGPDGLSLVLLHGSVDTSREGGGSATFAFTGLPTDGRWVVKDDFYIDPETTEPAPSNYDRWDVGGASQTISWTWAAEGTDGGAFRGLPGDLEVGIEPAFNDAAARLAKNYEGRILEWQVLSGDPANPDRYSLALDQPVTIRRGSCDDAGGTKGDAQEARQQDDQRRTKHEKKQQKHERKQQKHEEKRQRKHERKQKKHERKQEKHERKQNKHEKD
jgi:hypothetical protein